MSNRESGNGIMSYEKLLERAYKSLPERSVSPRDSERFVLPRFEVVISGKRTFITNFKQVSDKLNRNPRVLLRFILKEIGAPGTVEDQMAVIQGEVSPRTLNTLLQRFFEMYVKCPVCGSPDTVLEKKKKFMQIKCLACGATSPVKPI